MPDPWLCSSKLRNAAAETPVNCYVSVILFYQRRGYGEY